MSNIIAASDGRNISQLSTDELKKELGRALEVTARHLVYVASIWKELESRGEDLSALRSGLWSYIPLIASGKLIAELVVRYAGHTMLLKKLSDLPIEDQKRILEDDTIDIVEYDNGEFTTKKIRLTHLKASQLSQVMSDHIHEGEEQRRSALSAAKRLTRSRKAGVVKIAQANTGYIPDSKPVSVSLPLTDVEKDALYSRARENGITVSRLIRAALISQGLLAEPDE